MNLTNQIFNRSSKIITKWWLLKIVQCGMNQFANHHHSKSQKRNQIMNLQYKQAH